MTHHFFGGGQGKLSDTLEVSDSSAHHLFCQYTKQCMNKTALELSPQEWRRYHPAEEIARHHQQDAIPLRQRKERAWRVAREAAQMLRRDFGANRVVVVGSLAHEAWFTPWSDIDLAAWGIPPERFYAAAGTVAEFSAEFHIDLIDFETARPRLRMRIEREGRAL